MNTLKLLAVGAVLAVGVAGVAKADTLGDVQKRGALNCGVNGPTKRLRTWPASSST